MAVCRKSTLRCLSHSNHIVRQDTSFSNSIFVSRDIANATIVSRDFVRSALCDFGLSIFQYGPDNQLINRYYIPVWTRGLDISLPKAQTYFEILGKK